MTDRNYDHHPHASTYTNGEVKTLVAPLFGVNSDQIHHVVIIAVNKNNEICTHHTSSTRPMHDHAMNLLTLAHAQTIISQEMLDGVHNAEA